MSGCWLEAFVVAHTFLRDTRVKVKCPIMEGFLVIFSCFLSALEFYLSRVSFRIPLGG